MNQITVGVITVSDRASQGLYDDLGGPALKEAATRYGWQILAEAIVPDEIGPHPGDRPVLLCARLRSNPDHRGNGRGTSGRNAGSDSCNHARRIARIRRSDARRVAETDAECHFVALSGRHRRPIAGNRSAGQTAGCAGLPGVCRRRNSAFGEYRAGNTDLLLRPQITTGSCRMGRRLKSASGRFDASICLTSESVVLTPN